MQQQKIPLLIVSSARHAKQGKPTVYLWWYVGYEGHDRGCHYRVYLIFTLNVYMQGYKKIIICTWSVWFGSRTYVFYDNIIETRESILYRLSAETHTCATLDTVIDVHTHRCMYRHFHARKVGRLGFFVTNCYWNGKRKWQITLFKRKCSQLMIELINDSVCYQSKAYN